MKVLILVLSSDTYPSKRNSKVQKNTWAKELPNFDIHYKSGNKTYIKENDLIVNAGKLMKLVTKISKRLNGYLKISNLIIYFAQTQAPILTFLI